MKTITITLVQDISDDDVDVLLDALIDQEGVSSDTMRKLLNNEKVTLKYIPENQRIIRVSFDEMSIQVTDKGELE